MNNAFLEQIELLHPKVVHFPIALLLVGTLLWISKFIFKQAEENLKFSSVLLIILGAALQWAAVYTGHLADGVVARKICDPTVLKDHEIFADYSAYIFSAAALLMLVARFLRKLLGRAILNVAITLLLLAGSTALGYVGYLGGTLVYNQAAGVNVPSENCSEFE